jgi:hypothetical protein
MPLLGERGDRRGCDIPRVNERDAFGGPSGGESALFYLLRTAEEALREVISSQDGIGNAALLDPPLSVAIPPREAIGVVIEIFPDNFTMRFTPTFLASARRF